VISLTLFCLRRRQERKGPWIEASGAYAGRRGRSVDIDLLAEEPTSGLQPYTDNQRSHSNRSNTSSRPPSQFSSSRDTGPIHSAQFLPPGTEVTPFTGQSESHSPHSSITRKGYGGPSHKAPRFIVHHDAEDVVAEEEEVVELPPVYSESRRAPSSQGSTSMSGPSNTTFGDRKV
jgi:hypothetical protein